MTARKPDRRTERSRSALMSAFIAIVLSDGYDAVTVERVAERANVGRSTFYMHYKGKEDILRQSLKHPCSVLVAIVGLDVAPRRSFRCSSISTASAAPTGCSSTGRCVRFGRRCWAR